MKNIFYCSKCLKVEYNLKGETFCVACVLPMTLIGFVEGDE